MGAEVCLSSRACIARNPPLRDASRVSIYPSRASGHTLLPPLHFDKEMNQIGVVIDEYIATSGIK